LGLFGAGEAFEVGGGFACGLVGSRADGGGEGAVGCGVQVGVVGGEFGEARDGSWARESGETVGVSGGGGGEGVEDGRCFGRFEDGEQFAEGEVVARGDGGE